MTDFTLLAQAFGASFGHAEYDPAADLNYDWFINVSDFTQFASMYSIPCP